MLSFQYRIGQIGLKPFTREDLKTSSYREWFLKDQTTKHTSHGIFSLTEKDIEDYFASIERKERIVFAIYFLGDNQKCFHIGNVCLQSLDWINRSAEFAIIIGEPDFHKRGIGAGALFIMLQHAFFKLGFNRVWGGTTSYNVGMQKVFEFFGFKKEGVLREAKWHRGEMIDIYQYGLLTKEFVTHHMLSELEHKYITLKDAENE